MNEKYSYANASAPLFEDVQLDNHHKHNISPSDHHNYPIQSNVSTPIISHQQQNVHHEQQRHYFNEHIFDKNDQQNTSDTNSNGVVLLLNANEHLTVTEFV